MNSVRTLDLRGGALLLVACLGVLRTASLGHDTDRATGDLNPDSWRAQQEEPVRLRSAVDAIGRKVLDSYSDRRLAEYGIVDVTKRPYLADPTGKLDSTLAIQHAIDDARDARLVAFLPGGTYVVSDTIRCIEGVITNDTNGDDWMGHVSPFYPCVVMGSRSGRRTQIVLASHAVGFGDPHRPKPVIYVWAREEFTDSERCYPWAPSGDVPGESVPADPNKSEPAISYNQMVVDVDFSLGQGNPGAIALDHQGAQGSVIENVTVDATGSFAGIRGAPGSGGGIHGLTVVGGRYGLYLKNAPSIPWRGAQPVPVVTDVTLRGQTDRAILYDGRGPLTIVGGSIEGAGVESQGPNDAPWNGAMNIVDTVFHVSDGACAIVGNHSIYLRDVYFERAHRLVHVEGRPELDGQSAGWTHVHEYAAAAALQYPPGLGGFVRQDAKYLNGRPLAGDADFVKIDSASPPLDLQKKHALPPLPSWDGPGVTNVRTAPYGARGDGKADDTSAIQRAIDESDDVFIPKGEYRLTRSLLLKSRSRIFGVGNIFTILSPKASPVFMHLDRPVPLVETVDDAKATTEIAFLDLRVPVTDPALYALRWRAGRGSIVRDIRTDPAPYVLKSGAPPSLAPMIRIEGEGGGRWYDLNQDNFWSQGPDYRHLLVDGTREPLSFYMLNPEHTASDAQVEIRDARNVNIYSLKAEGMFTILWLRDSRCVRILGYGGDASPRPKWAIFRIERCNDYLLANADPDIQYEPDPAYWCSIDMTSDPNKWYLLTDLSNREARRVELTGLQQVLWYESGNP